MTNKVYRTIYFYLLLLWACNQVLWARSDGSAPLPKSVLPQKLLDSEYADIRNGFTVRPPFGSELTVPGGDKESPFGRAADLPVPADWQILKYPESKELVRFFEPRGKITSLVHLLATRGKMKIEQMAEARRDIWQKFPQQADILQIETTEMNKLPALRLEVSWQSDEQNKNRLNIHEAVVQVDKNRFFLLVLTCPDEPNQDKSYQNLSNAVINSFQCMDRQEQQQRWRQARQRAQQLLESSPFDELRIALEKDRWFRLIRAGEDIGFTHISEQWLKQQGAQTIQIDHDSFIQNAAYAAAYSRLLGWIHSRSEGADQVVIAPGKVRLQGRFQLDGGMKEEKFTINIISKSNGTSSYQEQGRWKEKILSARKGDVQSAAESNITENLEVNDRIYLSWVWGELLTRLMELKTADEYVFLRYGNLAMHYYSLRVSGSAEMKVAVAEDSADEAQTHTLKTTCLISQTGPDGPIVETWVDDQGRIIKQRAGDLIILRSTEEKIKELWPLETGELTTSFPSM